MFTLSTRVKAAYVHTSEYTKRTDRNYKDEETGLVRIGPKQMNTSPAKEGRVYGGFSRQSEHMPEPHERKKEIKRKEIELHRRLMAKNDAPWLARDKGGELLNTNTNMFGISELAKKIRSSSLPVSVSNLLPS